MSKLSEVVNRILAERDSQAIQWGRHHDQQHGANDWIALICKHAGRAAFCPVDDEMFVQRMIVVAALAIAAIEANDEQTQRD